MQKIILITGCSSGFGLGLTRAFLERGWRVIATARHLEKCVQLNELQCPSLAILKLDITSAADITAVFNYIADKYNGQLDCLINNAGHGLTGPFEELTEPQIRYQLEVNLFGIIFLTQKMLPFLRKTTGRVINISSVLGYLGMPMQSLYVTSKFALEGLSESLYYELRPHKVQVSLVEPGVHDTAFGKNVKIPEENKSLSDYQIQKNNYKKLREYLLIRKNGPAAQVTNAILKLLNKKHMPLRVRVGKDAALIYGLKCILPAFLFTKVLQIIYNFVFLKG